MNTAQAHFTGTQKRLDLLLNALLVLTVCACVLVYALPIFSNQLHARGSIYNFGTVKAATPVRHDFTVRNLHP